VTLDSHVLKLIIMILERQMEDFTRLQAAIDSIKAKVDALKAAPAPVNHQSLIDELTAAAEAIAADIPSPPAA
jgi:uncharacterized protein with LGFP repeats